MSGLERLSPHPPSLPPPLCFGAAGRYGATSPAITERPRRSAALPRRSLTRSHPLTRLLRNLWLCHILFAASQAAQMTAATEDADARTLLRQGFGRQASGEHLEDEDEDDLPSPRLRQGRGGLGAGQGYGHFEDEDEHEED